MKDYTVTLDNLQDFIALLQEELGAGQPLLITTTSPSTGKWEMARLWRKWMEPTSRWMSRHGATMPLFIQRDGTPVGSRAFNKEDAHEAFTMKWLGTDADGIRLSWSKQGHDGMRPATKGERFNALRQHEEWGLEKGLILTRPRDSEYARLEREQNA